MQTWSSYEYESSLLDALLGRVERELSIKKAKKEDPEEYNRLIKKEMIECYFDPVFFVQNYLYTDKNPFLFSNRIQTLVPYLLFEFQIETIDKLLEAVEK